MWDLLADLPQPIPFLIGLAILAASIFVIPAAGSLLVWTIERIRHGKETPDDKRRRNMQASSFKW